MKTLGRILYDKQTYGENFSPLDDASRPLPSVADKLKDIQSFLEEAYKYSFQSPRAQENINSVFKLLAEILNALDQNEVDCDAELKPLFAAPQPDMKDQFGSQKPQLMPSDCPASYIQNVPDHCDRIVWRSSYYMLPGEYLKPLPSAEEIAVAIWLAHGYTDDWYECKDFLTKDMYYESANAVLALFTEGK